MWHSRSISKRYGSCCTDLPDEEGTETSRCSGRGCGSGSSCTDLPDEEGTETVLAEDGEIDLEKSVLFAFCGLFHRNR